MKRLGLIPRFPPAMLFLATSLQAGEPAPAGKPAAPAPAPMGMSTRAEDLLKRFDKNHDGRLDEDETADAHEEMLQEQMNRQAALGRAPDGGPERTRLLEMFDKNHDGRLDDDERAVARKYAEEHGLAAGGAISEDLVKRFDRNGNGRLEPEEMAAMQQALRPRGAPPPAMRQNLLRQFDRNADGKINETEMDELEKTVRPRMEANPDQLQRYDRNGDGKFDDAEWKTAREQLLQLLNSPAPREAGAPAASGPAGMQERLARAAEEVARRRAERERQTQPAPEAGK